MINTLPVFRGHNVRIPIVIPVKRRGFIHGSTLQGLGRSILTIIFNFFGRSTEAPKTNYKGLCKGFVEVR